jgi:hypothetical protein
LVDGVRLDPDVARQHVRDEPIREGALLVEHAYHAGLVDEEDCAVRRRGRSRHAVG